jgi:glutathione synthase/RimK-type ligase-like ATP-grasp enzyme
MYRLASLPFRVQEFATDGNYDVRIFFGADGFLFGFSRFNPIGFVSNAARKEISGTGLHSRKIQWSETPAALIEDSERRLSGIEFGLLTVDLFRSYRSFYFKEANTVPGTTILTPEELAIYDRRLRDLAAVERADG